MNNSVCGKTMKNVRKHRHIKLVTTKKEETIWCQNRITIIQRFFEENLLAIEMRNEKRKCMSFGMIM